MADKASLVIDRLRTLPGLVVAFSGGVDSGVLSDLANEAHGSNALIATAVSPSLPRRERYAARQIAQQRGWRHIEVETNELSDPDYAKNAPSRCYFCRQNFFAALQPLMAEYGLPHIAMGTLSDDVGDHRPGMKAAEQFGVLHPLADAGIDKPTVREIARRRGLALWDKPATACLSSRIPYGTAVTAEALARVERAEEVLHDLGFGTCRVRDHNGCARIEVPEDRLVDLLAHKNDVAPALRAAGYRWITLDLEGFRSGSMNAVLGKPLTVLGDA